MSVDKLLAYIEQHLKENISLVDLVRVVIIRRGKYIT